MFPDPPVLAAGGFFFRLAARPPAAGLEGDQTARASARRAYRSRPFKAGCWWAALADATAAEVLGHIARGDRHAALAAVDRAAVCLGPVLPTGTPAGTRD